MTRIRITFHQLGVLLCILHICMYFPASFSLLCADDLPPENLIKPRGTYPSMLINGGLQLTEGTFPNGWLVMSAARPVYNPTGFRGKGSLLFKAGADYSVRQYASMSLRDREWYRFSYWYRTRNFKGKYAGVFVVNTNWQNDKVIEIPSGDSEWTRRELLFQGFTSVDNAHGVAIHIPGLQTGEIEIADICVEAATESAENYRNEYLKGLNISLIPLTPPLSRIPGEKPELSFGWYGDKTVSTACYAIDNQGEQTATLQEGGIFRLNLSGASEGKHTLSVKAGDISGKWEIDILPGKSTAGLQWRNNLNAILLKKSMKTRDGRFTNPRDGWLLFRLPKQTTLTLTDIHRTLKNGDFIELPQGEYDFTVSQPNAEIEIDAIAQTFIYTLGTGPHYPGYPQHDFDFSRKYILPVFTSYYGMHEGRIPLGELRTGPWLFLGRMRPEQVTSPEGGDDICRFPDLNPQTPNRDGVTLDEFNLEHLQVQGAFLQQLHRFRLPPERRVYSWLCGGASTHPLTALFLSSMLNLNYHNRFLYESYIEDGFDTEEEVLEEIRRQTSSVMQTTGTLYPGIAPYFGFIFCHSNTDMFFSIDNQAEIDLKYHLDLQWRHLATDPIFRNLGLCGFWGDNYADTEMTRWAAALVRHYVLEGNTELLSNAHGFSFKPKHIRNPAFRDGLKFWETNGNVTIARNAEFPLAVLKLFRYHPDHLEHYAVLEPSHGKAASIRQTLTGLIPGKRYRIKFITSNANDVMQGDARENTLVLSLTGGTIQQDSVRKVRKPFPYPAKGSYLRANLDDMIFTAGTPEAILQLSTENCTDGIRTALHYVKVMPYFEE